MGDHHDKNDPRGLVFLGSMQKNTKTLWLVLAAVAGMIGLSFASVPLYRLFCQATGFGGTTMRAESLPGKVLDRTMEIRFNADTSSDLPWTFKPDQHKTVIKIGQQGLVSFRAKNRSHKETAGTAIYNVLPEKAGKYFHKIQCFCFDRQALPPGQDIHMPVMFYIDPSIEQDREMDDVSEITLSYTFYPADSKALDDALEVYYNSGNPVETDRPKNK